MEIEILKDDIYGTIRALKITDYIPFDFGFGYSTVGYIRYDGVPAVINDAGNKRSPSIFVDTPENNLVGTEAFRVALDPNSLQPVYFNFKRRLLNIGANPTEEDLKLIEIFWKFVDIYRTNINRIHPFTKKQKLIFNLPFLKNRKPKVFDQKDVKLVSDIGAIAMNVKEDLVDGVAETIISCGAGYCSTGNLLLNKSAKTITITEGISIEQGTSDLVYLLIEGIYNNVIVSTAKKLTLADVQAKSSYFLPADDALPFFLNENFVEFRTRMNDLAQAIFLQNINNDQFTKITNLLKEKLKKIILNVVEAIKNPQNSIKCYGGFSKSILFEKQLDEIIRDKLPSSIVEFKENEDNDTTFFGVGDVGAGDQEIELKGDPYWP